MTQIAQNDEVEGIDDSGSDGWGDYPLDSVFVRSELRTVSEVIKRIDNDRYVLDPDFQRDFVWTVAKQSKLIESCIMRIPLPVFYVSEALDGRIIVVDGLQRLTTLSRFVKNQFKLSGLSSGSEKPAQHPLEGRFFDELSVSMQERVLDTQLTMYILDAKAPERARLDIFERVNSGEPLTRQQMRNALYSGPATEWLKRAAEGSAFKQATDSRLNSKTMRDREAINRYCAFRLLGPDSYTTGDMDLFLASSLVRLNKLSSSERDALRRGFDQAMELNTALFGDHAFRKSLFLDDKYAARSVINIALFEVLGVSLADFAGRALNDSQLRDGLHERITSLGSDELFIRSITYSTNSTAAVRKRFSSVAGAVSGALS